MAIILDGKKIHNRIKEDLKKRIAEGSYSIKPHLVIIQVGNNESSNIYIQKKKEFGESIGVEVTHKKYPAGAKESEVVADIKKLNNDPSVHGIIVQLPIADYMKTEHLINTIQPSKDVDGLSAENTQSFFRGNGSGIIPATTRGIMTLLNEYNIEVAGKHVTMIGRSLLVGKPTALYFLSHNATVTIAHSQTHDVQAHAKNADIIVVATGNAGMITKDFVKEGQVVIDVGINADGGHKIVGDVAFDEVEPVVEAISPVPGGVGPMTVASLFENLIDTFEYQQTL